jgi:hypothetical protein
MALEDSVDGNRGVDLLVVLRLRPEPYLFGVTPDETEARRLARDTGGVRLEWAPVIGHALRSRTDGRQAAAVAIAADLLNRMLELVRQEAVHDRRVPGVSVSG